MLTREFSPQAQHGTEFDRIVIDWNDSNKLDSRGFPVPLSHDKRMAREAIRRMKKAHPLFLFGNGKTPRVIGEKETLVTLEEDGCASDGLKALLSDNATGDGGADSLVGIATGEEG